MMRLVVVRLIRYTYSIMAVHGRMPSWFKYRHVDSWYLALGRGYDPALSFVTATLH